MSHDHTAGVLAPAVVLCVFGLLWAEGLAGLWVAAPVAAVAGALLVVTRRFGREEWHLGLLALAGLGIAALYAMAFTATVPSESLLAPVALGLGVGLAGSHLYARVARSAPDGAA